MEIDDEEKQKQLHFRFDNKTKKMDWYGQNLIKENIKAIARKLILSNNNYNGYLPISNILELNDKLSIIVYVVIFNLLIG